MAQELRQKTLSVLHMQGQDLYRQKQYEAALQCFTKAINQDAKAPAAIFDNRAATHTKLGNLRAALNDGREMIRQEKASCLGYLRTGKILQLLGNHEMALKLYAMGTRQVPSSDPNIMLLRGQHEKLTRQLAPPKAIDPLHILPLELAEMTIKYLDFRHMVGLLRVSKKWLQLLISMPCLWSDLDFSTAKKPVNLGAVREYIKRGNGTTTRVTLDRFGSNAEKIPRYVATRCRRLSELRVSGGLIGASMLEAAPCATNLKTLIISKSCEISCDAVSQLLSHCPNLERAEFQSVNNVALSRPARWEVDMPNLRTLSLNTANINLPLRRPSLALDSLLSKILGIHTLSVQGWTVLPTVPVQRLDFSKLHQLQHLNISHLFDAVPPHLPPTIRALSMADWNYNSRSYGVSFTDFDLPQMISLSLGGWHHLSLVELQAYLIANKGKATHLDLHRCVALSSANLKELISHGYLEGVEELALQMCNVDDEIAMLIARKLPGLKNLSLAGTRITGVGVKALVTGLESTLEHLCLHGCYSTSVDAVELARAMGVKVAFGFPDPPRRGRRIKQR